MKKFAIAAVLYLLSCFVYAALASGQTFKVTVIQAGTYLGEGRIESDGVVYTVVRHIGFKTPKLVPSEHITIAIENIHSDQLDIMFYATKKHSLNKSYRYDIKKREQAQ